MIPLEKEELLRLLDHCKLGILIADRNGILLWGNEYYNTMVDFNIKDYIGQHVSVISNKNLVSISGPLLFEMASKQFDEISSVVKFPTKDFIATTATPVFDESEQLEYMVYSITNCSESIRLQTELNQSNARARALETQLNEMMLSDLKSKEIIVTDAKMKQLYKIASRLAAVTSSVMITGESGVGKDVYAKYIHSISDRKNQTFIHVNLGAIPKTLFESELFGYEAGAFTGASRTGKAGLIELANGGTLFLDEIGELSLDIQAKLLQVIQDRSLRRIGSSKTIPLDIRIIAATNRNLEQMVQDGLFRLDLYYRLNVINIEIPPLRERKTEIPLMINLFLNIFNEKYNMHKTIDPLVMHILTSHSWPGNIRELNHIVENLVVISDTDIISLSALPPSLMPADVVVTFCTDDAQLQIQRQRPGFDHMLPESADTPVNFNLKEATTQMEIQLILAALEKYKTTTAAAEAMGIDISTLSKKRKKYGI